jgi:hypothetical protein
MDQTISILGQTILILVAFACLVALVFSSSLRSGQLSGSFISSRLTPACRRLTHTSPSRSTLAD